MILDVATHHTKAITLLGAEIMALRRLILVNRALCSKLDGRAARELECYVAVLEKTVIQLET